METTHKDSIRGGVQFSYPQKKLFKITYLKVVTRMTLRESEQLKTVSALFDQDLAHMDEPPSYTPLEK